MSQFNGDVFVALRHFVSLRGTGQLSEAEEAAATNLVGRLDAHDNSTSEYRDKLMLHARKKYGSNDVEIDDLTAFDISEADDGVWVRAWVWLQRKKRS